LSELAAAALPGKKFIAVQEMQFGSRSLRCIQARVYYLSTTITAEKPGRNRIWQTDPWKVLTRPNSMKLLLMTQRRSPSHSGAWSTVHYFNTEHDLAFTAGPLMLLRGYSRVRDLKTMGIVQT